MAGQTARCLPSPVQTVSGSKGIISVRQLTLPDTPGRLCGRNIRDSSVGCNGGAEIHWFQFHAGCAVVEFAGRSEWFAIFIEDSKVGIIREDAIAWLAG